MAHQGEDFVRMEWLKDKKNLPIVAALGVFVLLIAGGLIAFELGAFSGSSVASAPVTAPLPLPGSIPGGPGAPPISGGSLPGGPGSLPGGPGSYPGGPGGFPGGPTASVPATVLPAVKKSNIVNPAVGPDPFYIPGGQKRLASAKLSVAGTKLPVRDLVGPLNLFQIRPPAPPVPPEIPGLSNSAGEPNAAANYRLAGVITGGEGINAILEIGDQSQTVKPGDSLPDGSKVQNIQATSVTLRTPGGGVISLPLSAGNPDQGTTNPYGQPQQFGQPPYQPGFNGQSPYGGQQF